MNESSGNRHYNLSEKRIALLKKLARQEGLDSSSVSAISPRDKTKSLPLSFSQQRLWFLDQMQPGTSAYNIPLALRLTGNLDVDALEQSIGEIIRRHEVLRTTFYTENDQTIQRIESATTFTLHQVDLSTIAEEKREAKGQQLANEEASLPFDLARGPLLRATLIQLNQAEHVLLITVHHIVSDGWSMGIFYRELASLYEAFSNGKPSPLPELPIQYGDFTVWQKEWLQGRRLEKQLGFWKEKLRGFVTLELPTDKPRLPMQTFDGARHTVHLPHELIESLQSLSRSEGATLFMTLLTAFQSLLHRYTGQDDIVVGTPSANRNYTEIEDLIGFFVNTLVMRTNVSGNPVLRDLLKRVRKDSLDVYAHQDLPFEKLVEALQPERDQSRNPIFQVLFALQNVPDRHLELSGVKLNIMEMEETKTKFDLELYLSEKAEGLKCTFMYNTDLFNASTIERMAGHYQIVLESIVADIDQKLSDLPLLTKAEQNQILVEWNKTKIDYPEDKCVHELFEEQAEKIPDAIAVFFKDQKLTYKELNSRANQLARYLRTRGVGPGVMVGLYIERSMEMVVGLLAIIKAGGIYIPLDPSYPMQRITYMLEDSEAAVLVTQESLIEQLPASGLEVVRVDSDWTEIEHEQTDNLTTSSGPEDLSYVIYTSGSTGKPKGVGIPHRALVNFLWSMKREPGLTERDVLLSVTTLSFDIAALELFLPLIVGAKIVLVGRDVAMDAHRLIAELVGRGVTVMQATPATWRLLLQADWKGSPNLKVLIGGEALAEELANELLPRCAELWNMYGPTETTIWSTIWRVASDRERVLIGRPIANTQVYILDRNMQPVPVGVSGELYIGGKGLAREYLKRPELTSERFVVNPFQNFPRNGDNASTLIYKTGDLARWLLDGQIECLGRIDHQVKIRGFRIELGEIESVLVQHPGVGEARVIVREDSHGEQVLTAYLVPDKNPSLSTSELRTYLKASLPDYMVPASYVPLEKFPLTPNGKVDLKALPVPDQVRPELEGKFVAPSTAIEKKLAEIWTEVLKIEKVGVHDNFFDLGGHSLLIMQVHSRLQKAGSFHIEVMDFFKYPTIAGLAECHNRGTGGAQDSSEKFYTLFPVQSSGTRPPFFWFHSAWIRKFLPDCVGNDQPLYALMAQGFDGKEVRYSKAKDIINNYVREIRTVQPSGPYYLGGFCWGGSFAFEVAQEIIRQGEDVALLFLIEPDLKSNLIKVKRKTPEMLQQKMTRHLDAVSRLTLLEKISYVSKRLTPQTKRIKKRIRILYLRGVREVYFKIGRPLPSSHRLDYAFDVMAKAGHNYIQEPYPKDVVIIGGDRSHKDTDWSNVAEGEVKVHLLPGVEHMDLVKGPGAGAWAELLKTYLRSAQGNKSDTGV